MRARAAIGLSFLLLPGIVLAPVWWLAGLGACEDDILYYLPTRSLFGEMVARGQLPWWQDWTGLGRPFLADPQTAVFYPTTWLFGMLPPLPAYAISLWAHYSLAAWGAYRLLRAQPMGRLAAWFGALVFGFGGFMLAHRAHFAMQHAAAWLPWVVWRLSRWRDAGGSQRLTGAAFIAALQCFAGHVQIAALTALGSLVLILAAKPREHVVGFWRWTSVWLLAGWMFAVQWIPTAAYVRECTRAQRGYMAFVENSWYPQSAIGFVLPMLYGQRTPNLFASAYWGPSHQVEQFSYLGILPLVLAAFALRGWRFDWRRRPWVILCGFAVLLALGLFGPICPLLYWIPGASLFRVPARALLLLQLAVAVLSAHTLNELSGRLSPRRAQLRAALESFSGRPIRQIVCWLAIPLLMLLLAAPFLPGETRASLLASLRPLNPALWLPLLALLASLAVVRIVLTGWKKPALLLLIPALTVADLSVIGWTLDVPAGARSAADLVQSPDRGAWRAALGDSSERLWVVTSRSGWLPGEYVDSIGRGVANTGVFTHVRTLTDYGPLQPRAIREAFGFEPWGESLRARELLNDPGWMQWLNVGWVLLCDPSLPAPRDADPVLVTPRGNRLFRYPAARGSAFVADATFPAAVAHTETAPYAMRTQVAVGGRGTAPTEPLRVVVAKYAAPGWRATLNGQPVPILPWRSLLLSVEVPADAFGRTPERAALIDWRFEPPGLRSGAIVSLTGALSALGLALTGRTGPIRQTVRATRRRSAPRSARAAPR